MGKIAFVFSGQGAQYSGMGKEFYENYPKIRALYDSADALRPNTSAQSFGGTAEELKQTENTQPCLYLADLSAAIALEEEGIRADLVAGFSLGEIAALAFAGAYSHEKGFDLVCRRGEIMAKATANTPIETAMCAVLKLDKDTVCALAGEFDGLYPVNFNCASQTVVSGAKSTMPDFEKRVKEAGGRVVPLAVSGAFHSPYMDDAAKEFEKLLEKTDFSSPIIPVYANFTAKPYSDTIIDELKMQMNHPVRWQETVEAMIDDGVDTFIEVGAGKTLYNLIKKISDKVAVYNVENAASLAETVKAVKEHV